MRKPATGGRKPGSSLDSLDPNSVVGRKLKSFYESIETEPLPDQLLDLLEKLDEAERKARTT
ncbi:NepR family anti-sigma factor [Rhizobium sp. TRM96647]|uniref:NepR family anti-sigma factor n=1 Tax=unclassified Rhizobium TaxID=2613769 RepID=UPI001E43B9D7|nr:MULTISPECIES: NepR family anti-sigma factor [unclassified Rhizobium]MCD2183360.1 hypothetical protein [Rhizobium sp. GN54]MCV3737068.1 NepR family anti-sigma factor [Rhizobium sp. TRM96647]MCV3759052.1 NepR family anti-sigma factor [Rhizobium sp. TRM96650]